jgi:hypothetical protein
MGMDCVLNINIGTVAPQKPPYTSQGGCMKSGMWVGGGEKTLVYYNIGGIIVAIDDGTPHGVVLAGEYKIFG